MKHFWIVVVIATAILISSCLISLSSGPVSISLRHTLLLVRNVLEAGSRQDDVPSSVLFSVRLPRIVCACVVGWSLALAGLCFQALLRNPLADPYTLGLASGAAIGAVLGSLLKLRFVMGNMLFAFVGALIAMSVVLFSGQNRRFFEAGSIILMGIIFSALGNAVLSLILSIISPNQLHTFFFWFMGSFAMAEWNSILVSMPSILLLSIVIFLFSWNMNAISVNEDMARQFGIHVIRTKTVLYLSAGLLTALAVSLAGTIGFIGLVVPHLGRLMVGSDNRMLIPVVAILGASFGVVSDLIARSIIPPAELPVGVVTAFIGVPVFLFFMEKKRA
jgi:iron complex transport system permease protein